MPNKADLPEFWKVSAKQNVEKEKTIHHEGHKGARRKSERPRAFR
jgi:hypothetical protein